MNKNQRKFGIYVFLSTLSRSLIEVYIPVILYKSGYDLKEIVLYYLMINIASVIMTYPFIYLSKKIDNKVLLVIGIISFLLIQIYLNFIVHSFLYLMGIAVLYAVYRRGYWISRRYYNLVVIKKEKISTTYSIISIINQIGALVSTYVGALLLDFVNTNILTIIAMSLFIISSIPIFTLKVNKDKEKDNEKLELIKTIKKMPKTNIYHFGAYELVGTIKFLLPLFLYIHINNTYQTIGIVTAFSEAALLLFAYLFGKKLDKTKNSYLGLSIILFAIITILRINSFGVILLVISFAEGLIRKMYELSICNQFFMYSKNFEYNNYNLVYEMTQNVFRMVLAFIFYIGFLDIRLMIYITLMFILSAVFFKFKQNEVRKE